jgi:group I intron endonuclease
MHFVYAIQNKINLKIYIGYSSNPEKRWNREKSASSHYKDREYNTLLSRAIRKYGWDNFSKTIIEEFNNAQEALIAEKFWIKFYRSNVLVYGGAYGYNLHEGGGLPPNHTGKKRSEEHKKIISKTHKGKTISDKQKQQIGEVHKGTHLSQEAKQHLSNINKGRIVSKETGKKISIAKKGKKFSNEHKNKLSETKKLLYKNGQLSPWNKGKKISDKHKEMQLVIQSL